jgi:hypothetical protein
VFNRSGLRETTKASGTTEPRKRRKEKREGELGTWNVASVDVV